MKKAFLLLGKLFLLLIGLLLSYLAAAFLLPRIGIDKEKTADANVQIFILTNGVHTDIVVPTVSDQMDWRQEIKYENITAPPSTDYPYLAIGWGDKGFYLETPTWADLKASVAFKAAFGLSTTAIHTTYYATMKEGKSCKEIMISEEQYARLIAYISESFQQDQNGHVMYIDTDANYGKTDAFYEANGRYSMFFTCNTWANNGLKACGQRAAFWTPFDTGIFRHYE